MGRYGTLDYPKLTKYGFLSGVGLFALGMLGHLVGTLLLGDVPGWGSTLFADLEALGIVVALVSPFLFGIFLPLTE